MSIKKVNFVEHDMDELQECRLWNEHCISSSYLDMSIIAYTSHMRLTIMVNLNEHYSVAFRRCSTCLILVRVNVILGLDQISLEVL